MKHIAATAVIAAALWGCDVPPPGETPTAPIEVKQAAQTAVERPGPPQPGPIVVGSDNVCEQLFDGCMQRCFFTFPFPSPLQQRCFDDCNNMRWTCIRTISF